MFSTHVGPDSPLVASIEESVVQENFVELLDDLDVKASVDLFFGRGFVTADIMERINKATTRKDANRVLVTEFLAGISPSRFDKFVYILKETADKYHRPRHMTLAKRLEERKRVNDVLIACLIILSMSHTYHGVQLYNDSMSFIFPDDWKE